MTENFLMTRYVPTSPSLHLESLKKLLLHYVRSEIKFTQSALPNGQIINSVEVRRKQRTGSQSTQKEKTLVLMHGYGSGLGFFFENYDALADRFDRVIAVDWVGMGGSSRLRGRLCCSVQIPTVDLPRRFLLPSLLASWLPQSTQSCSPITKALGPYLPNTVDPMGEATDGTLSHPTRSVNYFIDNLEIWRQENLGKDSTFVLAGHSMGGYLSARYALKYPQNVEALVLISPVGLNQLPKNPASFRELPWGLQTIRLLIESNFTPQSIVRLLGPMGPGMVTSALDKRFGQRWSPKERDLLADYLYHITAAPASGEYSLNSLLQVVSQYRDDYSAQSKSTLSAAAAPPVRQLSTTIYAREPLHPLIPKFKETKKSVLVLFGDHDWLRYSEAHKDVAVWRSQGVDISLDIIPQAGHHLYMDNVKGFHYSMFSWLKSRKFI